MGQFFGFPNVPYVKIEVSELNFYIVIGGRE